MRILWNKAVSIIRPDASIPASEDCTQSSVIAAAGEDFVQGQPPQRVDQHEQHTQFSSAHHPAPLPPGVGALGDQLYHLAMRWRANGRWPAQTTAHIARSLGRDVCLQGLERVLWHMGKAMVEPPDLGCRSRLYSAFGSHHRDVLDLIRVRLHQEHAAHVWMDAFFRARFADLLDEELQRTGLLDCLDATLIDPGAFASSTYLPGDSREAPADEVILDGTSLFERGPPPMSMVAASVISPDWASAPGTHKVPIEVVKGLARQALARIRRDIERSSHNYGKAANALLRLGPVMRSMDALQVETDAAYRRHAQQFLLTEQGERLISVLPMARYLPDVIAARIDDLCHASTRVHGLHWAAQSDDPLTMSLSQVGQASALLGVQRSAWDAACRLLLFPESVALCRIELPSGNLSSEFTRDFISVSNAQHHQRIPNALNERRLTETFAHDLLSHDVGDQLHGSIAGYAMNRLWPALPAGRAAGLTQRWCRAWADLMTVCGPG
jgi:hypothetical protein